MKSFKFSEQEVELLIAMYEDELKEVIDYSDRLKETLSKLRSDVSANETSAPVKQGKKRGRKPNAVIAKVTKTTGKKRGRKPKSPSMFEVENQPATSAAPKVIGEKKRGRKAGSKNKKSGAKTGSKRGPKTVSTAIIPQE